MMNVATQIAVALLGCWEPVAAGGTGEITCVTMGADASELRVVTIMPGQRETESFIRLDGKQHPVDAGGCKGWESATASRDGARIHVAAEVSCENGPVRRRSAALLITPNGEWLHAEGVGIATVGNVQLQILRPYFGTMPESVRPAVGSTALEAESAREALRGERPTANDLVELEELGMAEPVIDVVVAAGHPKSFALGVGNSNVTPLEGASTRSHRYEMPVIYGFGYPGFYYGGMYSLYNCSSTFWGSPYSYYNDPRACGMYSYYARDPWNRYGGGYWPGMYPLGPVVIRPSGRAETGGRMVKGQGYTKPGSTTSTRTAEPRSVTSSSSGGTRSPSGTTSGSSSAGSSSGGSSSGGTRTAQPRKP
jgi:uncharacterized membrane protein YgcG